MWQKIRRMDYFSQQQEQKGNMTMIMQITANNTTHTVSWVSGSEQATAATSNLRELRRFCDAIIETVKKSSEK